MTTVGLKIDDELRGRLKRLGELKQRSTHWLMKQAILRYVEEQERYEAELAEDRARWERYVETGIAIDGDEMDAWMGELEAAAERELESSSNDSDS